ncbi:ATP-binding protein [Sphaerisporangium perillae]|uniref:ATP-binding protein n=1 Tax=Sphaerisporangium perillae TaxID=2935860 RepID=UPI002435E571|nr:LuxR family transcriptional regulator [Sphaerisporangium perillae]
MVSPVFVGREAELRTLSEAFEQARKEAASAVLLGGEAGGGKTRLVTRFTEEAACTGAHVISGGCVELSTEGLAYAPFTAALRQLVKEMGAPEVTSLLPDGASRDLARLLPEFGEPTGDRETETGRARLFEQILTLLQRLAERRSVILVIEDIHWADRSSRDLIAFLSRNLRTSPVLMIMTYRSDELHRQHPLRPVLAELSRVEGVVRLDVPRLSESEVAAQIAGIRGDVPEFALVKSIYQRSEGIPLFVEALMERDDDCSVPESLQDLIIGSVERLPEETQRLLRIAAAGGNRVGHELLAAVADLSDVDLENALRPAIAGNVIQVDGRAYAFRHSLIREAVHEEMLPGEHNRIHARFAEEIDRDRRLVPPGRAAIEIAHHWYSARDHLWALISAWEAAEKAAHAFAYTEQIQLLERVLSLWDRVPDAAERIGADHTKVLELASEAAVICGEIERGLKFVKGALAELDETTEPDRVAHLLIRRAQLKSDRGRRGGLDDLRYAERLVSGASAARTQVLTRLGSWLMFTNQTVEGTALTQEALGIARNIGDECLEAELLTNLALGQSLDGDLEATLRTNERAMEIGAKIDSGRIILRALANNVDALNNLGRSEEAVALALKGEKMARKYGRSRVSGAFIANNRAEALEALGRWDETVDTVEQALALDPPPKIRGHLLRMHGEIAAGRGEAELLEHLLVKVGAFHNERDEYAQEWITNLRLLVKLHLLRGRPVEALDVVEEMLEASGQPHSNKAMLGWRAMAQARMVCDLAATVAPERALAVAARAEASEATMTSDGPVADAFRLMFVRDYDAAAAAWEHLGRSYWRAMALAQAGSARAKAGDRDGAAARLRGAYPIAVALGARPLLGEIEALARRAGVMLTTAPAENGHGGQNGSAVAELTPRELEVLRLVALGRSNRDIAGELFISAKTVSVHVSNILGKLGASTRGEAAAAAHRLALLT